ncbi:peptide deformylase [Puniceibacterium sp. IMCC21224]|uniref:peptide deformylase n=1 Tax=Puniceibacterium sp. IMCC21224 TaxID=1618204 RepID=UPI00064D89AE|nr:peptide deformylase [Puniceibacterium sp. IMCC21224]KMK65857.1 peptide deformylase [Puniceibacterium sp. IMCC21224]
MSVLPILAWPDARLSTVCVPVVHAADVADLVHDMFETMYAAPGRGLAAPQVGALVRVFVMDTGWKTGEKTPLVCINPEIITASETVAEGDEGCLSILGVTACVTRPTEITLAFTDVDGVRQRRDMTGSEAICAQHELDHLDGLVTFDRLGAQARAALIAQYEARV